MNKTDPNKTDLNILTDTLIIGAGAAGLFCAWQAARAGQRVVVIDHANKAGKKILMSGGGKCNFTNRYVESSNYLSNNPHFCKSALSRYPSWEFIALVEAHSIAYEERKHGQLFCERSAKDVLHMLLDNCAAQGASIHCKTTVVAISKTPAGFLVATSRGSIRCQQLVVATGGLSIPTMGATGFGFEVATQFGHKLVPRQAGLVPFTLTDHVGQLCQVLAGVAVDVVASNARASFAEAMLFTHRGLSGPAMLQLSNYWRTGECIYINLLPNIDASTWLVEQKHSRPSALVHTLLCEHLPKRMAGAFIEHVFKRDKTLASAQSHTHTICTRQPIANLTNDTLNKLGKHLNDWQVKPAGTEGYRTAEVTLGGVCVNDISSKTMQSTLVQGLYFIGEVLDVTGWLGGYNFQWAWASAYVCAQALSAAKNQS